MIEVLNNLKGQVNTYINTYSMDFEEKGKRFPAEFEVTSNAFFLIS
jgi:hypothetical protein